MEDSIERITHDKDITVEIKNTTILPLKRLWQSDPQICRETKPLSDRHPVKGIPHINLAQPDIMSAQLGGQIERIKRCDANVIVAHRVVSQQRVYCQVKRKANMLYQRKRSRFV